MKTIDWTPNHPDTTGWKARHAALVKTYYNDMGISFARSVVMAVGAWIDYAECHQRRYDSPIGEDYVLGPAWARWGFALRELLNGETGLLDCGTLDTIICDNLTEMGFKPEDGAP